MLLFPNNIYMKKIIFISLVIIIICFSLSFSIKTKDSLSYYFDEEEIKFIEDNNLNHSDYYQYLRYKNFSIYNFYEYESIRLVTNSYLEAVNTFHNPNYYKCYQNIEPSLFLNTNYVLVNKHFCLDKDYVPYNLINLSDNKSIDYIVRDNEDMLLDNEVFYNLKLMFDDAKEMGLNLTLFSGYRSYDKQSYLYYSKHKENDYYSARPGHSEHQTGLAVDISTRIIGLTDNFKDSDEYKWLSENSYKYGFIERYKDEYSNETYYNSEPWHFRYVGVEIAKVIYSNNISLEEYVLKYLEI